MTQSDYFVRYEERIFFFIECFSRTLKDVEVAKKGQWKEIRQEYLLAEDANLLQFIERSLAGNIPDKYQYMICKTIPEKMAREIEEIVGFSVDGYKNMISASRVKHIFKRHGVEGCADNSLENIHDMARIGYIVRNYDNLVAGKKKVNEYKNKDNTSAQTIVLQKELEDEFYYVVEAVPDSATKALYVVSVYKNKKNTLLK